MSHDQVELLRLTSKTSNGSFNSTMSSNGTFSGDSLHHTDADPSPSPFYSSIHESNLAHRQYKAKQHQAQSSPSRQEGYVPSPMASSDQTPQAQYDIIPEKHKVPLHSSPSPPPPSTPQSSSMLQADNVLYAGAGEAAEMRHKTLTMSNAETYHKNKHRAEGSPEVHFDSKDEDHTCRTCALLLWGGVVSAMVVVALAGAALALAILFTGLVNICSQCDSTTATSGSANSEQALLQRIAALEELVNRLNETVSLPSATAAPPVSTMGPITTPTAMPTTALPTGASVGQDMTLTINNISLYMDCTTTIERSCNIMTSGAQCITALGHNYQRPGEFIMDISCVRVAGSMLDQNGLSYTLSIDETNNEVQCYCYLVDIINSGGNPPRVQETCGLRVTRCRTFSNITADANLTP